MPATPAHWAYWYSRGETTEEVASAADPQPDVTALSLKEFGELLKEAHGK